MSIKTQPPAWQKDAKPTKLGWVDPKTGELLVAIKLDDSVIKPKAKTVPKPKAESTETNTEEKSTASNASTRTKKSSTSSTSSTKTAKKSEETPKETGDK